MKKGKMKVLDTSGDTVITWDVEVAAEVETASEAFERLARKGFKAYVFKVAGQPGEVTDVFDPTAEKIIVTPPMVGG